MGDAAAGLVEQLARARRQQGVTQVDVAAAIGVTTAAVCGWEAHRDWPSPGSLCLWAMALGRSVRVVDDASGRWLSVSVAPRAGEAPQWYWLRCTVRTLRDVRREAGLTQAQVGELLGVSGWSVQMWENSRRVPALSRLLEWCGVLGCRLEVRR